MIAQCSPPPSEPAKRAFMRLGELGLLADQAELLTQPRFECRDDRPAPLPSGSSSLVGVAATDLVLDPVEVADAFERLAGDRRGAGGGELVEAPADMRPAECELYVALVGKDTIAAIPVDLQHAREARWAI